MSMAVNGMTSGMGFISSISIIVMLVEGLKQILTIYLLFKGIQVANLYLKNNKDKEI